MMRNNPANPPHRPRSAPRRACLALSLSTFACVGLGACKAFVPTATAELVGNPVLVGPVTRLGGEQTATAGEPSFEVEIKMGATSIATGGGGTNSQGQRQGTDSVTIVEADTKSRLDSEIMEQTQMDESLGVKITRLEALGRYWWGIAAAGINQELTVEGNTYPARD